MTASVMALGPMMNPVLRQKKHRLKAKVKTHNHTLPNNHALPVNPPLAKGADHIDLEEAVRRHAKAVFTIARRILGNEQDAEDITQEVFIKLYRHQAQIINHNAIPAWLKRVATNLAIDKIRRFTPILTDEIPDTPDPKPNAEQKILEKQKQTHLKTNIDQLPERQRIAVALVYYQEMSNREAAHSMQISTEALESLLARARRSLRKNMTHKTNPQNQRRNRHEKEESI